GLVRVEFFRSAWPCRYSHHEAKSRNRKSDLHSTILQIPWQVVKDGRGQSPTTLYTLSLSVAVRSSSARWIRAQPIPMRVTGPSHRSLPKLAQRDVPPL